jgi:glycosyltransferase involved in cell wall biosynthesis
MCRKNSANKKKNKLKIILASEYYYPHSKGGTEMYVHQLAKELLLNGHDCLIISLSDTIVEAEYDGVKVKYIPFIKGEFLESTHPTNLRNLISIIDEYNPDVFHLHTLSPSLGANHLLQLKKIGYKTIFTTHLPNFTCTRGDLLRYGTEICDGLVEYNKCMSCELNKLGVKNRFLSRILIEFSKYKTIRHFFPELSGVYNKIQQINIFKNIHKIITVSNWQKKVLALNKFVEQDISVVRQSISSDSILDKKINKVTSKITFGYIGRVVPEKGFHLLYSSLKDLPNNSYQLMVAAILSPSHLQYYTKQKELISELPSTWIENIESNEVISFLDQLDVLLVPSTWLETGPYVIYEALARKVPVIAFNRGGATELIENQVNGLLVNTEQEFKKEMENIVLQPEKLDQLISNIKLSRTTKQLYSEMETIYSEII